MGFGNLLINGVFFFLYEISSNFGNGYLDSSSEMGFIFLNMLINKFMLF